MTKGFPGEGRSRSTARTATPPLAEACDHRSVLEAVLDEDRDGLRRRAALDARGNQAIARAHRMGQVRPVHVHRILAKDSIDERIVEIQQGKTRLVDAFARRGEAKERDAARSTPPRWNGRSWPRSGSV